MVTVPDELQVSNEISVEQIMPYQKGGNVTLGDHIHAVVKHADPTTQLLFTSQTNSHLPDAGLNPLVDSASHLFFLMGKLKRIKDRHNLLQLHYELVKEVRAFQEAVRHCRYGAEWLEEYILITSYAVCMTLDDLISDTPWGGQGKWKNLSIVQAVFSETASQKSFFIILERIVIDPDAYIDAVEFLYICLSFGMKCHSESDACEFTHEQHTQISNFLYKFIHAYRGMVSKVLSPFPLRSRRNIQVAKFSWLSLLDTVKEQTDTFVEKLSDLVPSKRSGERQVHNDLLQRSMQRLQSRFDSMVSFIRKTVVNKNGVQIRLAQLPWYLLIGSTGVGKSSLLSKSRINFILGKKPQHLVNGSAHGAAHSFDWWITSDAVLVDVPGSYMKASERSSSMSEEVWQRFLALAQKCQKRRKLGGVIVAVSVSELVDRNARDELVQNLKHRIHEIQEKFGENVSFYFSITKMDLLPGFLDFFNDRTTEELMQAWGITMPVTGADTVTSIFIKRFNALIKIINKQMIQRLHYERDLYTRSNIKDFPLYVERIKNEFTGLLNAFKSQEASFVLKGVYLTSAVQNNGNEADVHHPATVSDGSEKMLEIVSAPQVKPSPYFVRQFILQGILQ